MQVRKILSIFAAAVTLITGALFFVRWGLGDDFGSAESHRQYVFDLWVFGAATLAGIGVLLMLRKLKK